MSGRLPDFMIIGAMKCGTSSLHDYLAQHKDVFMSSPKEIHYYADADYNRLSKEEYKSYFQTDALVCGTSPQSYTKCHNKYYQNIPQRILEDKADTKFIYIIREPIERYKSHILESYHCDPKEDIEYSKESKNYLKTGLYGMQLEEYLNYFPIENFHILRLEDLSKNRMQELNKIFNFLGIDQLEEENLFDFVSNDASTKSIPTAVKRKIIYRIGMRIWPSLSQQIANNYAKSFFASQMKKPILSAKERDELATIYRKDLKLLQRISGFEANYDL